MDANKPRGRPLEALGISEIEERVYEALLDHPARRCPTSSAS